MSNTATELRDLVSELKKIIQDALWILRSERSA